VDPVPDPLLLRKSGSTGNRTRTSGSVERNTGHRDGPPIGYMNYKKEVTVIFLTINENNRLHCKNVEHTTTYIWYASHFKLDNKTADLQDELNLTSDLLCRYDLITDIYCRHESFFENYRTLQYISQSI
jgi:hypothetical protein